MPDPASPNTQHLFTSESVSDGHPDKICDQISDAVLDACLATDPYARVAAETVVKDHQVILLGEISRGAKPGNIEEIVQGVLEDIGHSEGRWGLDINALKITVLLGEQSRQISKAVTADGVDLGAGDQGMMFGYACRETPELMPLPVAMAHRLMRRQRDLRLSEEGRVLGPDAKAQVTAVYQGGIPIGLDTVVLSTQHSPEISDGDLEELVRELIVRPVVEHYSLEMPKRLLVNPSGSFIEGGPIADAFRPYIVERLMPAVYRRVGVPEGLNAGALIEVVRSRSSCCRKGGPTELRAFAEERRKRDEERRSQK